MKDLIFKKIDAFALNGSSGNPAGYIHLNSIDDLSDRDMLNVAKELKGFVNEVGFLAPDRDNGFLLRFFSSEREVEFCGHATIGIMYDLIKSNPELRALGSLKIKTNMGESTVLNRIDESDSVFILSPKYKKLELDIDSGELATALGIQEEGIDSELPLMGINAGLNTLIVPIDGLKQILNISPDLEVLKKYCYDVGVDIVEVFTKETTSSDTEYRTRVFAPTFGYIEDPATGSGNSAFGNYLVINKLWEEDSIVIEQNGLADKFNIIKLEKKIDEDGETRIWFGGGAITKIVGNYYI